jgi:arylsulfatase A-like enzyme
MKRRDFLSSASAALPLAGCSCAGRQLRDNSPKRPNVILVLTDDQGYGDLGCHGNDLISTPVMDRFARESVEFTRFYVNPVCAPTRASLMTGRYHHRTGVMGVMSGEALIAPDETTIAALFREAGYRTAIFGKWHLGDNYPRRPIDLGFEEAVVHNGGGLSQPSCPPGVGYHHPEHRRKYNYTLYEPFEHWISSNNYFDPVLMHNGVEEQYEGYCTDIFFGEAIRYIEAHRQEPFFLYLPANAPHAPEIVREDYLKQYRDKGLDEKTARGYAMITNLDDNFGHLLNRLDTLGLSDNTVIIFMTDNGPQHDRYTGGLRGRKGAFYEGGIRVPFFIRRPRV